MKSKKLLSLVLCLLLCVGMLPINTLMAFAEGETYTLTIKYDFTDSAGNSFNTGTSDKIITGLTPGTVVDLSDHWPDTLTTNGSNGKTYYLGGFQIDNSTGGSVYDAWEVTGDQTLYVSWTTSHQITVTFDANGGSYKNKKIRHTSNFDIYKILNTEFAEYYTPTWVGYKFLGWALNPNDPAITDYGTTYSEGDTLYAIWEEILPVQVGQVNLYDGEYTTNGETKIADAPTGTGYACYTGGVLKLNNFEYEGIIENNGFIYATNDLDIELIGDNIIEDNSESTADGVINVLAELNIYGGGSLSVSSLKNTGIKANVITAKNVTLNIESDAVESFGLRSIPGDGKGLSLENVTANIIVGERGISSGGTMTIKNCNLDVHTGKHGIWANYGIEIIDSKVISITNSTALNHNQTVGKLKLANGHYVLEGNSDDVGAIYLAGNTLELPTSDFYYRTEKNSDFVKNSDVSFEYNKNSKEKYIEIFTYDRIIPVEIEWSTYTSFTYDGTEKAITATIKNKVDVNDDVTLVLSDNKGTDANTYTATVTGLTGKDAVKYTLIGGQNLTKNWEIAKADLTVTAKDKTITYGEAPTNDGVSYSGFVNNEHENVLRGELDYDYNYAQFGDVGDNYKIIPKGLTSDNYEIDFVDGILTVTEKEIGIDWTAPTNLVYDGTEKVPTFLATGLIDDDRVNITIALNSGDNINVGSFTYMATAIDNSNYKLPSDVTSDSYTITQAEPTITPPTASRVRRGNALSTSTFTGGAAKGVDGTTDITGIFTWKDGTEVLNTNGTEQKTVVFTPDSTFTNYKACEFDVDVEVYSSSGGSSGTTRYTVKFETNGGTAISSKTVTRNSKLTAPDEPTKENHLFEGWYTDEELTEKYDFDSKVTKSFTLYAKWGEIVNEPDIDNELKWNPFIDVKESDWFHNVVKEAYLKGLIKGTSENTFSPNGDITRGMFVTILYRAEGESAVNKSIPFADVKATDYYADAVIWAQQNEIVKGISENEFAPNSNITREQMAAILYRFAEYKEYDVSVGEDTNILSYEDFDKISEYAIPAMQWACGDAIISGKGNGILDPMGTATRAEAAAVLVRFLEKI